MARAKPSDKPLMRISGAARAAGVSTNTVEYYILLGLITPIRQPGRAGRFFNESLVRRIRLVRRMNECGYSLRAIRETYLQRR